MARKTTVQEAVTQVARNMSMVSGNGVQPYSTDQIIGMLETAHQFIVDEGPNWPDLSVSYTRTLDGSTGKFTQTIPDPDNALKSLRVQRVYHESSNRELPLLSLYNNPLVTTFPYGFRLLGADEETAVGGKYLVQLYPLTLTGQCLVQLMVDHDLSDPRAVIPIDWLLHVLHASWQYAADDGTNQGQIEKYKNLYNIRLKQVSGLLVEHGFALNPLNTVPNQWLEYDTP